MIALTVCPLTSTTVSTSVIEPQVHPVVLPDLHRVAPTMPELSPVIGVGAVASGALVVPPTGAVVPPPPQVATESCGA